MFEFGRDLRKLFDRARESEDLSWVELIGVDLLAAEARRQAIDAGRVSCARPHPAWLRASVLWREHARRTGAGSSLDAALSAAANAARHARSADDRLHAAVARAAVLLLRFDLQGGRATLDEAAEAVPSITRRSGAMTSVAAVHARIKARQARLVDRSSVLMDAAALLDSAIHCVEHTHPPAEIDDLRLDRAALTLEAGIAARDPRLLDQAGRELHRLVEGTSPDYRPLTRARALALCGAGLAVLAALAGDEDARAQGHALFDAAVDQFTPDHSPLDWVAIQVVRATTGTSPSLADIRRAEALSDGEGLILGALARDLRLEQETALAERAGDLTALTALETDIRRRLATPPASDLAWAIDQVGMARVALARAALTGARSGYVSLALSEAAEAARDHGVPSIAARAQALSRCLAAT